MQTTARRIVPGIADIRKKGIDSFLNFVILRTLGMLSPEDMAKFGGNSITDIDAFLTRVRGIFGMFAPDVFILHKLMDPSQNRSAGLVDIMVHTTKQFILYIGSQAPEAVSLIGNVFTLGVGGGIIGELIGYGLSIVPSMAGVVLSVSSKDPKGVLKNTAALIPFVGQDIVETIDRVDSVATNTYNKTGTLVEGLRNAVEAVKDKSTFTDLPLAPIAPTNLEAVPPQ
jgi:hypothetical protein